MNFKCNGLQHTLNVYKHHAKELQVVDSWHADEVSISEILFWKYLEHAASPHSLFASLLHTKGKYNIPEYNLTV